MTETIPDPPPDPVPQTGEIFSPSLTSLLRRYPSSSQLSSCRKDLLSRSLEWPLHRIKVLEGHTGCVNALSWTTDGETLISGGDDTTVRFWRMSGDKGDTEDEYPFVCHHQVSTGHWDNIFSAKMLPFSTRLATAARDGLVKVFDVGAEITTFDSASSYSRESPMSSEWKQKSIRCHSSSVKRITTELSPDLFLTVSEDGTVRQHDLRTPTHTCGSEGANCSPTLVKVPHRLFSMSIAPSASHQLVVAGDHPYGYLFDRRQIGRLLEKEWGVPVEDSSFTTCVRRFSTKARPSLHDYITAARVSSSNGHEVILSYGGHSVYLFSTLDDPTEETLKAKTPSPILSPNSTQRKSGDGRSSMGPVDPTSGDATSTNHHVSSDHEDVQMDESYDREEEEEEEEEEEDDADARYSDVPLILPRRSFKGISNLRTIKDVSFVGPNDEFVASGSDDGYFFLWKRESGALHGIYEGDESVVNVIEPHPTLPLIAVSGIDHEPKLFSPHKGTDEWSRLDRAENIIKNNMGSVNVPPILSLLQDIGIIVNANGAVDPSQCTHQ